MGCLSRLSLILVIVAFAIIGFAPQWLPGGNELRTIIAARLDTLAEAVRQIVAQTAETRKDTATRFDKVSAEWAGDSSRTASASKSSTSASEAVRGVHFVLCYKGQGVNCVIDGDTFRLRRQSIRILNIDTPETYRARCEQEHKLGTAATQRLLELLNAGPFSLEERGRDVDSYGRLLRDVTRGGESLGGVLVKEGYARWYGSGRRSWC